MKLNNVLESKNPKFDKPEYISQIYSAEDGDGRFEEVIKECQDGQDVKSEKLNTSLGDIYIFYRGIGKKKKVLLTAGLHGNESIGPKVASMLLSLKEIPPEASVMVVPIMNPDGFKTQSRLNKQNHDSNRYFEDSQNPYKELLEKIKQYNPTICIDLHEWHRNDGAFAYTNIDGIDKEIRKAIEYSGLDISKKTSFHADKADNGIVHHDPKNDKDSLVSWLDKNGYRFILPESKAEADPWSQITYYKKIIDLAFTI